MAHFLDIDFVRQTRRVSVVAVVLLLAGLASVGVLALEYLDARQVLEQLEARQARLVRLGRPDANTRQLQVTVQSARVGDAALERMSTQLQLPWDGLLRHLETATGPSVAVLSIDAQGQGRTARIVGEAKTMGDVVAYTTRLRAAPLVSAVTLSSHEARLAGAAPVVRFSLDLVWGGAP